MKGICSHGEATECRWPVARELTLATCTFIRWIVTDTFWLKKSTVFILLRWNNNPKFKRMAQTGNKVTAWLPACKKRWSFVKRIRNSTGLIVSNFLAIGAHCLIIVCVHSLIWGQNNTNCTRPNRPGRGLSLAEQWLGSQNSSTQSTREIRPKSGQVRFWWFKIRPVNHNKYDQHSLG